MEKGQKKNTQHDPGHFEIALELAKYVVEKDTVIIRNKTAKY